MRNLQLQPGEQLLHVERPSLLYQAPMVLLGSLVAIAPFFFFFPLISFGALGWSVLAVISGIGIFLIVRAAIFWRGTWSAVTTQRVVHARQVGLMEQRVQEATHKQIRKIAYRKTGLFGALLQMGSLRMTLFGVTPNIHVDRLRDPKQFQTILVAARKALTDQQGEQDPFRRTELAETGEA